MHGIDASRFPGCPPFRLFFYSILFYYLLYSKRCSTHKSLRARRLTASSKRWRNCRYGSSKIGDASRRSDSRQACRSPHLPFAAGIPIHDSAPLAFGVRVVVRLAAVVHDCSATGRRPFPHGQSASVTPACSSANVSFQTTSRRGKPSAPPR